MADWMSITGDLNAFTEPLVANPTFDDGPTSVLPGPAACMADLMTGLLQANTLGASTESGTGAFVMDALMDPVNEISALGTSIFVPPGGADGGVGQYVSSIGSALADPFVAMLKMQAETGSQSWDMLGSLLDSFGSQIKDKLGDEWAGLTGGSMLTESKIVGLLVYALSEGLPAIDAELVYLKKMRKLVQTLNEQASNLPPSFNPSIPNFSVTNRLCEAEERLRRVAVDLRNKRTFNRAEFGQATEAVCESKTSIYDGSISSTLMKQAQNFFGLNDAQLAALKSGKFLPNPRFRLTMLELRALNSSMLRMDAQVMSLHRNLQGLMITLEGLTAVHAADFLAIIVELLKRQIGALRADLQAQSAGFTGAIQAIPGQPMTPIVSEKTTGTNSVTKMGTGRRFTNADAQGSSPTPANNDIFSYMSSQVTAYGMLTVFCFAMQNVSSLYKGLDSVLNANSRIMKMIANFIGQYKGDACGSDLGATMVDESLTSYFATIEGRLNGTVTGNARIGEAAARVIRHIDAHTKFLTCMRAGLFIGNARFANLAMGVLNGVSAARNIASLVKGAYDASQAAKTMDLKKLSAEDSLQYNALDTIMRAIQCLVLQCNNEGLNALLKQAQSQYGKKFDSSKAKAVKVGTLGETPKKAGEAALNQRVQSLFRLVASLQRIVAMNPMELCAIDTKPKPKFKPDKVPTAVEVDALRKKQLQDFLGTNNQDANAVAEAKARSAAASSATPLSR